MAEGEGRAWYHAGKEVMDSPSDFKLLLPGDSYLGLPGLSEDSLSFAHSCWDQKQTKEQVLKQVLTPRWEAADPGRDDIQDVEKRPHLC